MLFLVILYGVIKLLEEVLVVPPTPGAIVAVVFFTLRLFEVLLERPIIPAVSEDELFIDDMLFWDVFGC